MCHLTKTLIGVTSLILPRNRVSGKISPPLTRLCGYAVTWLRGKISPPLTRLCGKISHHLCGYAVRFPQWSDIPHFTALSCRHIIGVTSLILPRNRVSDKISPPLTRLRGYAVRFPHHLRGYAVTWLCGKISPPLTQLRGYTVRFPHHLRGYAVTRLRSKISPSLARLCGKISPPLTRLRGKISPPLTQLRGYAVRFPHHLCGYAVRFPR